MRKIITLFILAIFCVVIIGCKQMEEESEETVEPEEPSMQPPELPSEPASEMPVPASEAILSELQCIEGDVQGKITNVLDESVDTIKMRIIFNGMTVNPRLIVCDKETLMPGESTLCSSLQGVYSTKGENVLTIAMGSESTKKTVTC